MVAGYERRSKKCEPRVVFHSVFYGGNELLNCLKLLFLTGIG